ncbi:GNAT family protein [Streptomyces sp. NPDC006173]|uniref:GNAT family N-acetyltransferase n=1 Tax=Streptomyces sp. NPDC006173 TaxID=3155349 RepID=UPI0033CD8BDF
MNPSLEVPHLDTGHGYLLRPWQIDDLALVREASADEYIPLITTVPTSCSDAEGTAFVHRQWDRAASGAGYPFVIVRPEDGKLMGTIGLWVRDRAQGRASLGYWVVESARGQGAAVAALRAVAIWGLRELAIPRMELHIEPWNEASLKTAERAGFLREGLLRSWQQVGDQRCDMYMYSLVAADLD